MGYALFHSIISNDQYHQISERPEMTVIKSPDAAVSQSPDDLSCAVCTDIYTEPKLLHCMHSFCGACIEKMVMRQEDEKPSVVCPICRFVTHVCIFVSIIFFSY